MSAPTQPQSPQFTHGLVPLDILGKVSRVLTRLALDGQEAAELVQAFSQSKMVNLPDEGTPAEDPPAEE